MPSSRHPVIRGFYFYMYFLRGVRALPPVERQGAALYYRERRSQLQVNAAGALLHDCGPSKEQYGIQKLESSTRGASCCYSSRPHCYSIAETLSVVWDSAIRHQIAHFTTNVGSRVVVAPPRHMQHVPSAPGA